jgi:hypothetical protein
VRHAGEVFALVRVTDSGFGRRHRIYEHWL